MTMKDKNAENVSIVFWTTAEGVKNDKKLSCPGVFGGTNHHAPTATYENCTTGTAHTGNVFMIGTARPFGQLVPL